MKNPDTWFINSTPRQKTILIVLILSLLVPVINFSIIFPLFDYNRLGSGCVTIVSCLIRIGIALWAIKSEKIPLSKIGISASSGFRAIILLFVGWMIAAAMLIPLIWIDDKNVTKYYIDPYCIIKFWLFVGMSEELLFRGYLLTTLLNRLKYLSKFRAISIAVLCSSAFFTIIHIPAVLHNQYDYPFFKLSTIFYWSLILSYFFLRTRNILFCGLLHGYADYSLITNSVTIGGINLADKGGLTLLCIVLIVITEVMIRYKKAGRLRRFILSGTVP